MKMHLLNRHYSSDYHDLRNSEDVLQVIEKIEIERTKQLSPKKNGFDLNGKPKPVLKKVTSIKDNKNKLDFLGKNFSKKNIQNFQK